MTYEEWAATVRRMLNLGLLEEKRIYHGAESPVSAFAQNQKPMRGKTLQLGKPYLGYSTLYRIKEAA